MRTALCLAALVACSQAHAATISTVAPFITAQPGHLVVLPVFANTSVPAIWNVRDRDYAGTSLGWLDLGYRNTAAPGGADWVTAVNIVVPDDGTPIAEFFGAGVGSLTPLVVDFSSFLAAGDANIQLILPSGGVGDYQLLTVVSPHLGTVNVVPEPAGLLLMLGAAACLVRRRRG
jgi:hypothetical protein